MEPTKRGPFNRVLRTFRRRHGSGGGARPAAVRCTAGPEGHRRPARADRETNAQRAAAEALLHVYGGFDADGRRRFLELLATKLGADPDALDRAAEQLRHRDARE